MASLESVLDDSFNTTDIVGLLLILFSTPFDGIEVFLTARTESKVADVLSRSPRFVWIAC